MKRQESRIARKAKDGRGLWKQSGKRTIRAKAFSRKQNKTRKGLWSF
jgi:hypothetical protein